MTASLVALHTKRTDFLRIIGAKNSFRFFRSQLRDNRTLNRFCLCSRHHGSFVKNSLKVKLALATTEEKNFKLQKKYFFFTSNELRVAWLTESIHWMEREAKESNFQSSDVHVFVMSGLLHWSRRKRVPGRIEFLPPCWRLKMLTKKENKKLISNNAAVILAIQSTHDRVRDVTSVGIWIHLAAAQLFITMSISYSLQRL